MGSMPPAPTIAAQQAFGLIDRQVLGAPAASISFAGLDTANKMFRSTFYIVNDANNKALWLRLNNDGGANYDMQSLRGNGAAVSASRPVGQTKVILDNGFNVLANEHATLEIIVAKQQAGDEAMLLAVSTQVDGGPVLVNLHTAAIWNNVLALISRQDVLASANNFAAGTVAILEGNITT